MAQYKLLIRYTLSNLFIIMWSTNHFPSAMRSLNPTTRTKAIEIANQLLEQGEMDKQHIVSFSVDEARRWARCQQVWSIANRQPYSQFTAV